MEWKRVDFSHILKLRVVLIKDYGKDVNSDVPPLFLNLEHH